MKKIASVIFITFALIEISTAVSINCNTQANVWSPFGTLTECLAYDVVSTDTNTKITGVKSYTNLDDFDSFYIYQSPSCHFFPKDITTYFDNLKILVVANTGLKSITKDDLKPFENIRGLYIDHSKLTSIDGDLFRYTKNLEDLSLQDNNIKFVEADIFKPLRKLNYLSFDFNDCINKRAGNRNDVEELFIEIEEKCNIRHEYKPMKQIETTTTKNKEDEIEDEGKSNEDDVSINYSD
ncbi:hypothetical protein PVAND_012863 [Polypedilum vanderplanki]|uniref:Uncharacterized protein n=1 Tax=Polypedilum vanderplanki TaxID=319348 RepID=A0A9J6CPS3_POLVA|nr:hypothetical protein PVAND_012863 [Polypedilum vanderplanki]